MRSSSRRLPAAFALLLVGGFAFAQAKTHFDPARDLPSFEEARSSEYKELYTLDPYIDLLGKDMDKDELAKVQAKWKEDLAAAQKHISDLRNNPKEGHAFLLTTRLSKHKFFSKIAYTIDTSTPPFFLIVQKPPRDDPQYGAGIAKLLVPYLAKLSGIFEARIAKPAGVARRADVPWTAVAILASPGDYQNFARLAGDLSGWTVGAAYDSDLDVIVGVVDAFENSKNSTSVIYPIARETFASFFDAYVAPPADSIETQWFVQGLSSALAYPRSAKVESLDAPEPRADVLQRLVEMNHDHARRPGLLFPVSDLAQVHTWMDVVTISQKNSQAGPADPRDLGFAFVSQSSLWMYFLMNGENGKHHASFERYVKLAMSGLGGPDALSLSFSGAKLADLDRAFWSWVYDQHKLAFPSVEIDRGDLTDMFVKPPKETAVDEIADRARDSVKKTPPGAASGPPPEPPFVPATLAIADNDFESRHGMALVLARSGDLEGARSALQALVGAKVPVPDDGRIARDLERVSAAIQLRDAYLDFLVKKGARLAIEHDGKKINALVAKVENGEVVFAENKQGVKSLPVRTLDPLDIAKLAEKKETQGNAPPWTRAWIHLLAGDAKWEKLLKLDSDAARDLRDDGNVWYADRLRTGRAALAVDALSKSALPKTRAEAEPLVAALKNLMSQAGDLPGVLKKKSGLQKLGRAAVDVLATGVDPAETLHGKVTAGQGGALTIAYEFDDPAEAGDFVLRKGYLAKWRQTWPAVQLTEEQSTLQVKDGALRARGMAVWGLPIAFRAPMSLHVDFKYAKVDGVLHAPPLACFHVCDDGKESYVHVTALGDIFLRSAKTGQSGSTNSPVDKFFYDQTYHLVIENDGKQVVTKLDGQEVGKVPCGPLISGGVEFIAHSETDIVLERLEVEGRPEPESLAAARAAWANRKMTEIGF